MERQRQPRSKQPKISPKYKAMRVASNRPQKQTRIPVNENKPALEKKAVLAPARSSSSDAQLSPNIGVQLTEHTKTWHIKLYIYKRIVLKRKPLGKKLPYSLLTTGTILSYLGR